MDAKKTDKEVISKNRSSAKRSRLVDESAKLDPKFEKALAEGISDFEKAVNYVLNKNTELYHRLA
jgi:hypothetical protein